MNESSLKRKNPYSSFLIEIEKPARYIGGEKFEIVKNWTQEMAKVALCFPDTYEIGMGHLGFKILYDELNKNKSIVAERVFAPWIDMEKKLREKTLPLVTLENFRALAEFDILGFSLQYEMSYTNILNMLDLGGVSVMQSERQEEEPFVIAGGPCATHPEPLADFMDFFVIGDGESLFVLISHYIHQRKKEGVKRAEILKELSSWDGIYVPSLYDTEVCEQSGLEFVVRDQKIKRFFVENLKNYPIPTKSPIPHLTAIFDRYSVELARGCTEGCRFCQAGMIYRPVRERSPLDVKQAVIQGIKEGGFEEASLTCLSTADYSAVTPLLMDLLDEVKKQKATLGISSLRAYGLDEKVLDKMAEMKNSSLTFAPEAGTERMRKVINKNVSEQDMMNAAKNIFSRGWSKMKLYFMIGLPTETDEDVQGIMETAKKAKNIAFEQKAKNPQITVSASSFVPKPHTPFQWCQMISLEEIERKQLMLWKLSKDYKIKFKKHYSKTSILEAVVARGDRKVGKVIYEVYKRGGRFDGWEECFDYKLWMGVIEELGLEINNYLSTIPLTAKLPWDHIDVGLEDWFLEREWKKATKDRLSPPCGKVAGAIVHHSNLEALSQTFNIDKKRLVCYDCGLACDLKEMVVERSEFLVDLGAIKDEPYLRPAVLKKDIAQLREKRGQEIGYKYRIEFSKMGSISFISHLDLLKVIGRIFKRSEIPVLFSEGYKGRALISFGPALALGVSSLSEFFDVRVPLPWENLNLILETLQKHSEKGIIFKRAFEVDKKSTSIQEAAKGFKYTVPLSESSEDLVQKINTYLGQKEITLTNYSVKKRKDVSKDIRPFIDTVEVGEMGLYQNEFELVDEVSPCIGKKALTVTTKITDGRSVRPNEIEESLQLAGILALKPIKVETLLMS